MQEMWSRVNRVCFLGSILVLCYVITHALSYDQQFEVQSAHSIDAMEDQLKGPLTAVANLKLGEAFRIDGKWNVDNRGRIWLIIDSINSSRLSVPIKYPSCKISAYYSGDDFSAEKSSEPILRPKNVANDASLLLEIAPKHGEVVSYLGFEGGAFVGLPQSISSSLNSLDIPYRGGVICQPQLNSEFHFESMLYLLFEFRNSKGSEDSAR